MDWAMTSAEFSAMFVLFLFIIILKIIIIIIIIISLCLYFSACCTNSIITAGISGSDDVIMALH